MAYRIDTTTILSDEVKTRGESEAMLSGEAMPKLVRLSTGVFGGVVIIKYLAKMTEVLLSTGVLIGIARAKSTRVRTGLARKD